MREDSSTSIKLPDELRGEVIGEHDLQITDMYAAKGKMPINQYGCKTFEEWCFRDCQRIGDSAYVVEHYKTFDGETIKFVCIMRAI